MKKIAFIAAAMLWMHCALAQIATESTSSGPVDDSFVIMPDTLTFLTGSEFMEGKPFQIINNHDYPIDIIHIDQFGIPCPTCIPWYTYPTYPVYPVTIPPQSSITTLVRFYAIDQPLVPVVNDTLEVNTAGHSGNLIIIADSNIVQIGIDEPGNIRMVASPNPFTGVIRISVSNLRDASMKLTVYNTLMQPVKELYPDVTSTGSISLLWNGTDRYGVNVGKGVYFVVVQSKSAKKTLKVVKL